MEKPPVEIERKFLVGALPDLAQLKAVAVRQGYLTAEQDSVEIRLRQMGDARFMTVKSGAGLLRAEREIPLDLPQFNALWAATGDRRIEKTRHLGHLDDGILFELDVFQGALAPLTLVEVEFASIEAAAAFVPPGWFGAEVTEDARFKNKALATSGNPLAGTDPAAARPA